MDKDPAWSFRDFSEEKVAREIIFSIPDNWLNIIFLKLSL